MRYTKIALLTFGAGLILGLVVVVAELDALARVASGLMALGVVAIPVGLVADWRLAIKPVPPPARKRAKAPARRTAASARRPLRPRKPAPPKR
ncbi:MAG TPA: hypothetical protein VNV18_02620 [Stellaceae bacterium]|jgi:hypothetical protein|nr:hypothetical protein [Stellaceae bacterium]